MTSGNFFRFRWVLCISLLLYSVYVYADDAWQPPIVTVDQQRAHEEIRRNQVRIGNSSIWVWKSEYEKFMNEGELPIGVPGVELRGPISKNDVLVFQKLLAPYLDKNYFRKNPKPKWYKPNPHEEGYWVNLDSEGGDVYAAMAIGRMFRKARVWAHVGWSGKCMSSCILLLAGAVKRSTFNGGPVGIHRPYSINTEAVSFEELQTKTTKLGVDVAAYLQEMNIPSSLYETMRLTPPENIKILSLSELEKFGLYHSDPVFAELNDNMEADLARVSKQEFLSRKALSIRCQQEGMKRLRLGKDGLVDTLEFAKMARDCETKTIYKDVVDKSGAWRGDPSDDNCLNLAEATADAYKSSDWQRVLEAAIDREHNCVKNITEHELADIINDQANAYLELGNLQEAVSTANRCLRIAKIADCHITKGYALLMLSRYREGADEAKLGKKLADQEMFRLRTELKRATSASETGRLKAGLDKYNSLAKLAHAIMTAKPPRP